MSRAFLRMVSTNPNDGFSNKPFAHLKQALGGLLQGVIFQKRFPGRIHARYEFVQQHSGDWAMTGKVPVARVKAQEVLAAPTGRMKVIQHIKTMAGSPNADLALRPASRNLAHGFMGWRFMPFVKP